ncbi:MAG: molybdopterin-dependent oxidoreductase [Acidimicrobiales bacterium]
MSEETRQGAPSTGAVGPATAPGPGPPTGLGGSHVGRRALLGFAGLGVAGILVGAKVQSALDGPVSKVDSALGGLGGIGALVPGSDYFRIYTVTASLPAIAPSRYRLRVDGLVERPMTITLDDLRARWPRTKLVHLFQCVTGWQVPDVHWEGVRLSAILDAARPRPGATALRLYSGDGVYTESLSLPQARLPDVLVADRMIGDDVSAAHGGPVRLYVAPMYGYKSIKWLDRIEVVDRVVPGYWEGFGYPVNAWIGGVQPT